MDGDHRAWITVEADSKDEAMLLLPSTYRGTATVTQLNKFTIEQLEELLKHYNQ